MLAGIPAWLTVRGDRLFFAADDGVHGIELWSTDGTFSGTTLAGDVAPGSGSSSPEEITLAGDRSMGSTGRQKWRSLLWLS